MKLKLFWIAGLLFGYCSSAHAQVSNPDLIAQAKREGRVAWYTTVSIPESQEFAALFQKQFPFLKVDIIRTGSSALVNRMISEHNAGKYLVDVLQGFSSRGGFRFTGRKDGSE
jgi:iron(III) transport system substrate-binding protein